MKYVTTKQAAKLLNYTGDAQVRKLIERGQLHAEKFGRVWLIPEEELGNTKRAKNTKKLKTS